MPSAATAGPDGASDIAAHRARIGKKYARRRVARRGMTSSLASIELSHHGKSVRKPKDEAIDNKEQAKSLSFGEYLDQSLRGGSISIWSRAPGDAVIATSRKERVENAAIWPPLLPRRPSSPRSPSPHPPAPCAPA